MPPRTTLGFPSYPSQQSTTLQPTFTEYYLEKRRDKKNKRLQPQPEDQEDTMAITRKHNTTTRTSRTTATGKKPSLLSRLRNKNQAKVTTSQSTNPITGTTTTTQKTTTHPNGIGYRGHGGRGPMASNHTTHYTTGTSGPVHHHKRKTSMGDKISGALLKLKGSATGRSGQKVSSCS